MTSLTSAGNAGGEPPAPTMPDGIWIACGFAGLLIASMIGYCIAHTLCGSQRFVTYRDFDGLRMTQYGTAPTPKHPGINA